MDKNPDPNGTAQPLPTACHCDRAQFALRLQSLHWVAGMKGVQVLWARLPPERWRRGKNLQYPQIESDALAT